MLMPAGREVEAARARGGGFGEVGAGHVDRDGDVITVFRKLPNVSKYCYITPDTCSFTP
jgi:hypothetical protein